MDLALRVWNRDRPFEGSSNTKDIENVRSICYEFLDRTQDLKASQMKAIGVLATLGDITKADELLTQLENHVKDISTTRNILLYALSDYNSHKDIFWKVIESEYFHCQIVGSKTEGV